MSDIRIDDRFLEPFYSMVKAIEMAEVPLLVLSEQDQWSFLEQAQAVLRGIIVYGSAPDARQQLLAAVGDDTYVFVAVDGPLAGDVFEAVEYYLRTRDIIPSMTPELSVRFEDYPIAEGNRLILVSSRQMLQTEPHRKVLGELATVIAISA
jgi:hypothetical protein